MHRSAWAFVAAVVMLTSAASVGVASAAVTHAVSPVPPVSSSPSSTPARAPSTSAGFPSLASLLAPSPDLSSSLTSHLAVPQSLPSAGLSGSDPRWVDVNSSTTGWLPLLELAVSAWDPADHETVVFGGLNLYTATIQTNTWVYRNGAWLNITAQSATHPGALEFEEMGYDPSTGDVVLTGGLHPGAFEVYPATWTFSGGNWTNVTATAGSVVPTAAGALIADPSADEAVLSGGLHANNIYTYDQETYVFKDGTWTNVSATAGPGPHADNVFTGGSEDPAAGGIVIDAGTLAGISQAPTSTYLYAGGTWANVTATTGWIGGIREIDTVAYDAAAHAPVAFGGFNTSGNWHSYTYALINGAWTNWTTSAGFVTTTEWGVAAEDYSGGVVFSGGNPVYGCASNPSIYTCFEDTWNLAGTVSVTGTVSPTMVDVGQTVSFNAWVSGGFLPMTWGWTFGDSMSASTNMTTHAYTVAGTYEATFWATDALGNNASWSEAVTVVPGPYALPTASTYVPDVGQAVFFTGSSTGGIAPLHYDWAFSDGTFAHGAQNPVHAYTAPGTYRAWLWVNDSTGASSVTGLSLTVHADPSVTASATPTSGTTGTSIAFAATPTGGAGSFTYLWNFTDGSWSSASAPTHAFASAGTFHVYLTVTDAAGRTANASVTVTVTAVLPPLSVSAVANVGGGTVGTAFTFTATASGGAGGYTYAWSENPASGLGCAASTSTTLSCTSTATGSYTVTVTVTDSAGHTATANVVVTVLTSSSSSSGSSSSGFSTEAIAVIAVLAILAALLAVMWLRKGKPAAAAPVPPPAQ
jgi:PKD repeat protein